MADLDDDGVVDALHQAFYNDLPRQQVADALGVKPPAPPPAPPSSFMRRAFGDTAISGAKAVIGVPESLVGVGDLATGGRLGKGLEDLGVRFKDAKAILDDYYSPEQKEANQKVQDAQGFLGTAGAMLSNPSTILNSAIENSGSLLPAGGIARGTMWAMLSGAEKAGVLALPAAERAGAVASILGKTKTLAASGLGQGMANAGANAEDVRQQNPEGTLSAMQSAVLAGGGLATAAITGGVQGLADSRGISTLSTMLATGKIGPMAKAVAEDGGEVPAKGMLRRMAEGAFMEGVPQEIPMSYEEQVAKNIAMGVDPTQGAGAAAAQGMMAGGLQGAFGGAFHGPGHIDPNAVAPPPGAPGLPGVAEAAAAAGATDPRALKVPVVGPMTAALNAGLDAQGDRQDQGLPPLAPAPGPAGFQPTPVDPALVPGLLAHANARAAELAEKAKGTPDTTLSAPDGTKITVAGKLPQFLTPDEKAEQDILKEHGGNAEALNQIYQPAEPIENALASMHQQARQEAQETRQYSADDRPPPKPYVPPETTDDSQPPHLPGDVLNGQGAPFKNKASVLRAQQGLADPASHVVASVQGGFVLRPVSLQNEPAGGVARPAPATQVAIPAPAQPNSAVASEAAPAGNADAGPAVVTAAAKPAPAAPAAGGDDAALKLPKDLAGAKPNYAIGTTRFALNFDSDVDKASFIAAQPTRSARDVDYVAHVVKATGMTEQQVREHGVKVGAAIKAQAKAATVDKEATPPKTLTIPEQLHPDRADAGPVERAIAPLQPSAAPDDEAGARWTRTPQAGRLAVLQRAGWTVGPGGKLSLSGDKVMRTPWDEMSRSQRDRLTSAFDALTARAGPAETALAAAKPAPAPKPVTPQVPNEPGVGKAYKSFGAAQDALKAAGPGHELVREKAGMVVRPVKTAAEPTNATTAAAPPKAEVGTEEKPAPAKRETSPNKVFTDDMAAAARARMKAKLGRANSGIDPELLQDGITLAGYHIEKGARTFAAYSKAMLEDMGEAIRPYLKQLYMALKHDPRAGEFTKEMSKEAEVEAHVDEAPAASAPDATTLTSYLAAKIEAGAMPKDNPALRKLVETFDRQDATPARTKEAQEALESAIVGRARQVASGADAFPALVKLYESQPNLNVRTSTSVANQAYSTPAPLAWVASELAHVGPGLKVYEPTAGNGMLLIKADPKTAVVNEMNPERAAALSEQGFDVTKHDATTWAPPAASVDRVIANPPFGGTPPVQVDGHRISQIDHLIAAKALEALKDDGQASLILGANKVAGGMSSADRIFFNWLYSHYNVTSHFEVDGDLYQRQGAAWPVRVITIDGRLPSERSSADMGTIARADSWESVYEQYQQSLDAGNTGAEPRGGSVGAMERGGNGPVDVSDAARDEAHQSDASGQPRGSAVSDGNVAGNEPQPVRDQPAKPDEGLASADRSVRPSGAEAVAPAGKRVEGQPPARGTPVVRGSASADSLTPADNEFQTAYVPRSSRKDEGVLIPVNMAEPTQLALSALEDKVGDLDAFAAKELGYKDTAALHGALMGLQVDSVASAIQQVKEGKGIVIADQTGIGKGRQAAAMIRWATRNGKVPIFVTKKPELFTDMYGDLHDIGTDDVAPFIMNRAESIAGEGDERLFANSPSQHTANLQRILESQELPAGRNALFSTYSQLNTDNVQRKVIMALAHKALFILDESHAAAGESGTGEFMQGALNPSGGTVYLSATYAKRPDNMPVYFKTDIGAAMQADALKDAFSAGGLPLQTVVSNNLVRAGQMFRRERSYNGVNIETRADSDHRAEHEKLSDATTSALRSIVSADRIFHAVYIKHLNEQAKKSGGMVIDNAGNQATKGVDHTEFSAVVHNFVRQMLLGLKAQESANRAIVALKEGKKPLIAVDNTMGSFLQAFVDANALKDGDPLGNFDYRTVLSRALERTRYYTKQLPTGQKLRVNVKLADLDPQSAIAYAAAQKIIDKLDIGHIPVSPIDWIRQQMTNAGHSVSEITGRNLAVDYSDPANPKLTTVPAAEQHDKVLTTRLFNSGKLDSLILNVSGSTGISLHASEKFTDQRPRRMIVAQPAQDINVFMQMLGRIHRTGQVALPSYELLNADLPAETRPTALLAGKMKSLNANTSSNTESATSVKAVDLLNKYGDQVVNDYLLGNPELAQALDVDVSPEGHADSIDGLARKATGRLALMPVKTQAAFYADVAEQYKTLIDYLNATHQNELEPRTIDYDAKELKSQVIHEGDGSDSPFGQDAVYGEYSVKRQGKAMTPDEIRASIKEHLGGVSSRDHATALLTRLNAGFEAFKARQPEALHGAVDQQKAATSVFVHDHPIGSTFRVDINGDVYNAAVTNIRSTDRGIGNPFALSKVQVTLAVDGGLRSVTVPASRFAGIEQSRIAQYRTVIDDLFRPKAATDRDTAKIVTGNLLAGYGALKGAKGSIVTFTKQDGTTEQGIHLARDFDTGKELHQDYRLKSGADALKFLGEGTNENLERFGINSRDSVVRVMPAGRDGVTIQVPKSKAKGGKFFLDAKLLAETGDFVSEGNSMRVTVRGPKAVKALDVLMKKQALYALPSMADEARGIVGDVPVANGKGEAQNAPGEPRFNRQDFADQPAAGDAAGNIRLLERGVTGGADSVHPYVARRVPGNDLLQQIAGAFGDRFQGFTLRDGLLDAQKRQFGFFNGAYLRGTIYIRATGNDRPHLSILGHELAHRMAVSNPDLYAKFVEAIRPYVDQKKYAAEFLTSPVAKDVDGVAAQREEFVGEVLSDGFMDKGFWRAAGEANPSMLRSVVGLVGKLIDRIKAKIGYNARSAPYLSDFDSVMKIAGGVMAEYAGSKRQGDGDVRFNRQDTLDSIRSLTTQKGATDALNDLFRTQKTFNSWWHQTVATQYHKAQVDPEHFGKVYQAGQDYLHDTNAFANDAANLAPDVITQLRGLKDLGRRIALPEADRLNLAKAAFDGTLNWMRDASGELVRPGDEDTAGVVFTPDELRQHYNATDDQIKQYQQFRASVDRSLDTLVATDVARYLGDKDLPPSLKQMVSDGDVARFKGLATALVQQKYTEAEDALASVKASQSKQKQTFYAEQKAAFDAVKPGGRLSIEQHWADRSNLLKDQQTKELDSAQGAFDRWETVKQAVNDKYQKVEDLKNRGYAPLMRFGQYTVTQHDDGGKVTYFSMFENERDANKQARLMDGEPGHTVTQGVMSKEAFKQFRGMTPETMGLFAELAGIEKSDVFQQYLQLAIANHSALKRMIHRKGTAGYAEDASRALATFVTSNARAASGNLHLGEMSEAIANIPKEKGDVIDEAQKLRDYLTNPREEARTVRGLLFTSFLGGSFASALVNTTQPVTMTIPFLSEHSNPARATAAVLKGMVDAVKGVSEAPLKEALLKAEREGIVSPQEIHQLHAEASRTVGNNPAVRKAMFVWGSLFSLAEQFNRRASFIAAHRIATENGHEDPYAFATNAVDATQGVYNKGNRPNWARGAVGGTLMTFKQFSISYLELLKRLPVREKALAFGILALTSGAQGMPFADDTDDIIDSIAQHLGYDFNSKLAKTRLLSHVFGQGAADFLMHGASAIGGSPGDVSGRMGLGNLIPGSGLFLKSKPDKGSEVADIAGPVGSLAQGVGKAIQGDPMAMAPTAIQNLAKAVDMLRTGMYRTASGKQVIATTPADAVMKGFGVQPRDVAAKQQSDSMSFQQIALAKAEKSEITSAWARGIFEQTPDKVTAAQKQLREWNANNPESRISVDRGSILSAVKQMRETQDQRLLKSAPKGMRGNILEAETAN